MKRVWGVVILLTVYGSLYPFNFTLQDFPADLLADFASTWNDRIIQGDFLANIIIFIPYGLVGWYVFNYSTRMRLAVILGSGFILGMGLQLLQYYLPSRYPSIIDGWSNLFGILLGCLVAWGMNYWQNARDVPFNTSLIAPITLLLFWFGLRLMPFIPFFRWKQVEISLRPLYQNPQINPLTILSGIVAWTAVFYIFNRLFNGLRKRTLFYIAFGCFTLETLIIYNYLHLSDVIGALGGVGCWLLISRGQKTENVIFVLMVTYIVIYGLSPFKLAVVEQDFHWVPFTGFIAGSVFFNIVTFFSKFFFYGGAVWFGVQAGMRWRNVTLLIAGITLMIELAQVYLVQHVPEITDPLLVVLISWVLHETGKTRLNFGRIQVLT
ncbi:VanZ family protein [Hahella ganghwensis]|uniref:VanZ family protein n=1 Tax=Hahella ganghwensis TaxID=286420 RepID=UPI0003654AA3|nr:VanZ family protein [Hahella ganghwensis]